MKSFISSALTNMSTYPVQVSDIAPSTTKSQLHDFFSFCGPIAVIDHEEKSATATIRFEKASAAKTALMLNGGTLDGATLSVTSDTVKEDEHLHQATAETHIDEIDQSDKPRAAIAAEYLARGYKLSDQILEHAIAIDKKHGISKYFLTWFNRIDEDAGRRAFGPDTTATGAVKSKLGEQVGRAKAIDEAKGYSKTTRHYYEQAIASQVGQRVRRFYTETSKQVHDIHEEARHIAQSEKKSSLETAVSGTESSQDSSGKAPTA
ncbi:hypothetical protein Ac2012v2_005676 [Leucoagaricus gongylophorus]